MLKNCEVCNSEFTDITYNKNRKYCALKCQWTSPTARASSKRNAAVRRKANPIKSLLKGAKRRASKKNLEFHLYEQDIFIPEFCPILGLRLAVNKDFVKSNSPSLDRKDSTKGYTKDNVHVISHRANCLKSDATKEELLKVIKYLEGF